MIQESDLGPSRGRILQERMLDGLLFSRPTGSQCGVPYECPTIFIRGPQARKRIYDIIVDTRMWKLSGVFLAAIMVGTLVAPAGSGVAVPLSTTGIHLGAERVPVAKITNYTSTNWAGYAVTAGVDAVWNASATWVQPAATCNSKTALAVFWVGIDGFNSYTVEQTGTIIECLSGRAHYFSWWEMYPLNDVQIVGKVHPGDHISASVNFDTHTGKFKLVFQDLTSGTEFTKITDQPGVKASSAECIAEAPGGATTTSGIYPLADFGTMRFTSCSATLQGEKRGIGGFSTVVKITMVSFTTETRTLARPGPLSVSGSSFKVTWRHSS